MPDPSLKRLALAVIGGLFLTALIFGVAVALSSQNRLGTCTVVMTYGWVVPLVSGLIIGFVALLLLDSARVTGGHESARCDSDCPSCGKPIDDDWRMCPHCGEMLSCDMSVTASSSAGRLPL